MSPDVSDPDAVSDAVAQAMWDKDMASRSAGLSLDAVGPGAARLSVTITAAMTNGHRICHGGYIFLLADSTFAYACNSHNQNAVAQHCSVTFLRPAYEGDRLTAAAREVSRIGRSGVYDIKVTNQNGEHIAKFRGHSRTVNGTPIVDPA